MAKGSALIRGNFGVDPYMLDEQKWAKLFGEAVWLENMRLVNLAKILAKLFSDEKG